MTSTPIISPKVHWVIRHSNYPESVPFVSYSEYTAETVVIHMNRFGYIVIRQANKNEIPGQDINTTRHQSKLYTMNILKTCCKPFLIFIDDESCIEVNTQNHAITYIDSLSMPHSITHCPFCGHVIEWMTTKEIKL